MLKYQFKFLYTEDGLIMYRRCALLGIIPINKWVNKTTPIKTIPELNNICLRRGIKSVLIENTEE